MASMSDKLLKVGDPGTITTLEAPGKDIGASSLQLTSSANWPNGETVIFSLAKYDVGSNKRIDGSYTVWKGIVSGSVINNLQLVHGSDQQYEAGGGVRAMIGVSSALHNSIVEGLLVSHNPDGTIRSGAAPIERLENVDINTAIPAGKHGVYFVKYTCSNIPVNTDMVIINYHVGSASASWDRQVAFDYNQGSVKQWTRRMSSGAWGPWTVADNESTYMLNGQNINSAIPSNMNGTWYIQNGNTNVPQGYILLKQDNLGLGTIYDRQTLYDIYTMEPKWFRKRDANGSWETWTPYGLVYFNAYRSTARSVSANTYTPIDANAERYDSHDCYRWDSGVNGYAFICPATGIYEFTAGVDTESMSNSRAFLRHVVSGGTNYLTPYDRSPDNDTTASRRVQYTFSGRVNKGTKIKVEVWSSGSGNIQSADTFFSGKLIGRV